MFGTATARRYRCTQSLRLELSAGGRMQDGLRRRPDASISLQSPQHIITVRTLSALNTPIAPSTPALGPSHSSAGASLLRTNRWNVCSPPGPVFSLPVLALHSRPPRRGTNQLRRQTRAQENLSGRRSPDPGGTRRILARNDILGLRCGSQRCRLQGERPQAARGGGRIRSRLFQE